MAEIGKLGEKDCTVNKEVECVINGQDLSILDCCLPDLSLYVDRFKIDFMRGTSHSKSQPKFSVPYPHNCLLTFLAIS